MESAILIGTVVITGSAVVFIGFLLRMIVTGDYSLLIQDKEPQQAPSATPLKQVRVVPSLDLAVVHFVKEPAEHRSEAERKRALQRLVEVRKRRQRK